MLCLHLKEAHQDTLHELTSHQLKKFDLFVCRQCEEGVYSKQCDLNKHIIAKHTHKRANNNFQIATEFLYQPIAACEPVSLIIGMKASRGSKKYGKLTPCPSANHSFLCYTQDSKNAPSMLSMISFKPQMPQLLAFTKNDPNIDYNSKTFFLLVILFQQLVRAPSTSHEEESVHQCLHR